MRKCSTSISNSIHSVANIYFFFVAISTKFNLLPCDIAKQIRAQTTSENQIELHNFISIYGILCNLIIEIIFFFLILKTFSTFSMAPLPIPVPQRKIVIGRKVNWFQFFFFFFSHFFILSLHSCFNIFIFYATTNATATATFTQFTISALHHFPLNR